MDKNMDSARFALFVALMNCVYKGALCLMRRFSKNEKRNAFVAGFLAGLAIIVDHKDRRLLIALIFFSRAIVLNME
jgi:hypothetical protein